jgi:NAD(P)-dependent dehydrogenase (short-subunit alcohol dehydrogenase family)
MELKGKVVVVTGGGSGIGAALCRRFAQEGARAVVVVDIHAANAEKVAAEVQGLGVACNVAEQAEVQALVDRVTQTYGQIDLFCSNAGIITRRDSDAAPADWQRHWDVNLMAHVHAANAVLPQMLARGEGYLLQTASAAGLLSQVNAAPYTVTKHAAVGFAEWLSIAHGDAGIRVSCLCPQGVLTPLLLGAATNSGKRSFLQDGAVTPEALAEVVVQGLRDERFLILPHEEVLTFWQRKTADVDRWLKGMRRLRAKVMGADA